MVPSFFGKYFQMRFVKAFYPCLDDVSSQLLNIIHVSKLYYVMPHWESHKNQADPMLPGVSDVGMLT